MARNRKVLKIGKLDLTKAELELVIINNHSEVVTKEVASELKRLRSIVWEVRKLTFNC